MKLHTPGAALVARAVLALQALLALNPISHAQQAQTKANRLNLPSLNASTNTPTPNRRFATAHANNTPASPKLPKFISHRDYLAADGPSNLAVGDLNGDGINDVVVPNHNTTNISVLLGNRDGSFQPFVLTDTGGVFPFDAAIADFNGDGKNDVAVTSATGVSVLLGDGHGNFGAPLLLAADQSPSRIIAADLNGDHRMDLAVTNVASNDVSIFLGRGDGTFAPVVNIPVGGGPSGLAVADLNHDGHLDLVVANSGAHKGSNSNTVAVLLGEGNGSFQPPAFIPVGRTPLEVAIGDFNHDNRLDLAVTNGTSGDVSELLGNGDGTFQPVKSFPVVKGIDSISVGDFNGDGNQDLIVTNGGEITFTTVSLLLGDGLGNFKPARQVTSGRAPLAVLAGDFNHDGKTDFMTANADPNTISVVLGKGDGTFFDIAPGVPLSIDRASQITVGDLNGDGILDLAVADEGENEVGQTVEVLLGKGNGTFAKGKAFPADFQPQQPVITDFNHDGHPDLLVANFGQFPSNSGSLSLLLSNGRGFQKTRNFPAGDFPLGVAVADFNGDGNPDAAVMDFGTDLGVAGISLLLGNGKDAFAMPKTVIAFPEFTIAGQIASGDFNGDGKADLAYLTSADLEELSVQFGNGDGTFQNPIIVASESAFQTIFFTFSVGDFNGDGKPDFAIEEDGFVEIVLGDGNGHFTSAGKFSEGSGSSFTFVPSLVLADFNGDGKLDVAAVDGFGDTISFMPGNGDGTLGTATLFGGGLASSATGVDINHFEPSIVMPAENQLLVVRNATAAQ